MENGARHQRLSIREEKVMFFRIALFVLAVSIGGCLKNQYGTAQLATQVVKWQKQP
jgi:hypothetical protein